MATITNNKTTENSSDYIFRIFDYNDFDTEDLTSSNDGDKKIYTVQLFGIDEFSKKYSVNIYGFKPFFYLMVNDKWTNSDVDLFKNSLTDILNENSKNKYYNNSIVSAKLVKRKKLYGFDGKKEYCFIHIEFANLRTYNNIKKLWFEYKDGNSRLKKFKISPTISVPKTNILLYEANINPILRFFHLKEISPSGWISIPKNLVIKHNKEITTEFDNEYSNKINCDYILNVNYEYISALNEKEVRVPYKIMSFDIEASSSHGDFPIPVKDYQKLADNIIEYFETSSIQLNNINCKLILKKIIYIAFGFINIENINNNNIEQLTNIQINTLLNKIQIVYPKEIMTIQKLELLYDKLIITPIGKIDGETFTQTKKENEIDTIEECDFEIDEHNENMSDVDEEEEDIQDKTYNSYNYFKSKKNFKPKINNKNYNIIDILCDNHLDNKIKLDNIIILFNKIFPKLEGDKVTFIGSTFMNYGDKNPQFSHCIVLNSCDQLTTENTVIESYSTERDVLLAWQNLVQKENPDIIIGYNIFGFDYNFLFKRAEENKCLKEFLKLSKNQEKICAKIDNNGVLKLEESSIQIASGQHDLKYIKMDGRLQIDLYNFYRRTENLSSYKLDFVAGNFIGDYIKKIIYINKDIEDDDVAKTEIITTNLTGLLVGTFIHIEEIGHSIEYYSNAEKYIVVDINYDAKTFKINKIISPDFNKKVRWCLAKDDITPKDIFNLTNGTSTDRSLIAKYCIQDCNLLHYLFNKSDILTGYIEMSKICSVPINFLVMRGQGIKLTSYIAKKCREKNTLMPVINKGNLDECYEGAIVLEPKCNLYLDNPVACVDYASLYPSSMISENLSHDSKVWTKEYDLVGNLIEEWGEKDQNNNFIYDNLTNYEYVDIKYDTYTYIRKTPKSKAEKVKCGYKICRFAQFPNEEGEAIMPSILKELLKARKDTRKQIPLQTDEFMKQVLEQRQLGYKVTANSLYGGTGAKTSTFYEKDIAACTTATGRKLLTYAKKIIETCYYNKICQSSYGPVLTKAEYIYGDTDSVFFTFNLQTKDGVNIVGKKALEITIELAQEAGNLASSFLKGPHDLEYEKTFMPFCLLSKKRYVGMLYETDPNKCKRKEMGIVLKRRDNAPIVKDIYGGIIDILMKKQNIQEAIEYLKSCLENIVNEKYQIDKLIISKSLRTGYKNPQRIAHKVLADRITTRDPGNKPSSGDRIPFVYIVNKNKNALQGEKIETPSFIKENKIKIDYSFYITNQIMKPVQQVFALVIEKIWEIQNKPFKICNFKREVANLKKKLIVEYGENEDIFKTKFIEGYEKLCCDEVKKILFDEYLIKTKNERNGLQNITNFITVQKR